MIGPCPIFLRVSFDVSYEEALDIACQGRRGAESGPILVERGGGLDGEAGEEV